ncbi:MAG: cohesin domain-containing protein, partial [Pyrinomonadaceae bacterium]
PANISVTAGSISPGGQVTYNASVPGTIIVSMFNSTSFSGSGSVVDIHMKVIGSVNSVSPLTLVSFRYNGGAVCSNSASGTLTVVAGSVSGRVAFENEAYPVPAMPTPTPLPVPNAQITATGGTTFSTLTNATGNYSLSAFGPGSYTVTPSRTNENFMVPNGISSNDPSLVAMHVVQSITLNAVQQRAADVSGLHTLSSFDAGLIAQWIVGINNQINQSGQWKFTPVSTTPDTLIDSTQNYKALLMGDVNGDWSPFVMRLMAVDRVELGLLNDLSVNAAITASVPNIKAAHGTAISIPFRIDNLRGRGIMSYQFDIEYDPSVIEPANIAADLAGTISEGFAVAANSPMPGLLKVVVFGTTPLSVDGVFVNLHFKASGGAGSTTPLTISGFRIDDAKARVLAAGGTLEVTK